MRIDYDVIVAGGGISGLACAWWLQRRGCRVALLEASDRAGGTIGSTRKNGYLVEAGPNSALETTPLIGRLLAELGIAGARVDSAPPSRKRFILRQGRLLPLPLTPAAFVATPLFSPRAKLRLLREPFVARGAADADESIADFVRRRLGPEFLERAIDPFVAGVYAGSPDRISVRAAFPKLHRLEQEYGSLLVGQWRGARARSRDPEVSRHAATMFSFESGMQTLTDALARQLAAIETDACVTGVARRDDVFVVQTTGARGARSLRARTVVLAVPAHAAARLVASIAPAAAAALDAIPYAPVAVVASGYRGSTPDRPDGEHRGARHEGTRGSAIRHPLDGFGFLVPGAERRPILGTIFSSSLFAGRAPQGSVLLTTFVGGAREPLLAQRDDADLTALVEAEHAAVLGAPSHADFVDVRRWPRAIPQYTLGHLERIAAVEDAERALPGLHFCANYRGGVSLGDCIRSAAGTVERVLADAGVKP